MSYDENNKRQIEYDSVFPDVSSKAKAFDEIAKRFFFGNFGTMQKSDIEVLLFSLYLDQILDEHESDINAYSDYTLAKKLGIPQTKVSTLKVKKQLQYPYEKFNWKISFQRLCGSASYESEKIRINLRDKNLYYELRNQIDMMGGYVETTLTPNVLSISPEMFINLSKQLMTEEETDELLKAIKNKFNKDRVFCEKIEKEPIGNLLKEKCGETIIEVVCEVIKSLAPQPIGTGIEILKATYTAIHNKTKSEK